MARRMVADVRSVIAERPVLAATVTAAVGVVAVSMLRAAKRKTTNSRAVSNKDGTRVFHSDDGRGHATRALRDFAKGEIIFQEPALAAVYPSYDKPWLAALRKKLLAIDDACAWQYCVAVHCLTSGELPTPLPDGLTAMAKDVRSKLDELCGEEAEADMEPSELAVATANSLLVEAACAAGEAKCKWPTDALRDLQGKQCDRDAMVSWMAKKLDIIASRVARNGFQVANMKARPPTSFDGLFHRISFFNHCCASMNNASWVYDGTAHLLTVKATKDVIAGEEFTISYIAKPWCDLAKPARRQYLKQNFGFVCLCKACTRVTEPQKVPEKPKDLLGLLSAWMKEERDDQLEDVSCKSVEKKSMVVKEHVAARAPLTDEERIERLLKRCHGEGIVANAAEAQKALEVESGHVGKALIRMRKAAKA